MRPACLILLVLAVLCPGAALAQEPVRVPCRHDDKECAAKALKDHAITKLDYWRSALARPLEQRIGEAPSELVEFLTLDNIQSGFPDKPRAAKLNREFLRDLQAAITELPPGVRHIVSGKLAGIHLVRNLGGTGFTDTIYDAHSNAVAGFIVLDVSVLEKRANAWATWKENTPFEPQSGFRLTALIETRAEDSRKNAIQYILLHELGHVVSINEKIHPSWNVEPKDASTDYPYFNLSWTVAKESNRYLTKFDAAFTQRKDVVYYLKAKLPAGQMVDTYDNLLRTNFATLYAVTNPADDFAEAFASYVHTVLMKKPFEIRIYRDGKIAKVYKSCWTEQRCAAKRAILESLVGGRQN
ncbi:MAG TPA: hypothetical protein VFC14_16905 [Burkholderiales bacterium]|nr:hypothetical protein [Burkholderiales bacterium]